MAMAQATGQGVPVSSSASVITFEGTMRVEKRGYVSATRNYVIAALVTIFTPIMYFIFLPVLDRNGPTTSSSS